MWLIVACPDHGVFEEKVENDNAFFRGGYDLDYKRRVDHLVLPLTYRCNLKCKYCYTLSNTALTLPPDRPASELAGIFSRFNGNITFIGGEPTLRNDLADLISLAKREKSRRVSLATNGQKLRDPDYVKMLDENGLDFVFLSINDIDYENSATVRANKIEALENCRRIGMPVWLQQTIDEPAQLDSTTDLLSEYNRTIFTATIRAVRSIGINHPARELFLSDILRYLKKEGDHAPGASPFNRYITLAGKKTKICSWVNDMSRLDPIDSKYIAGDGTETTFHRGIKMDEVAFKARGFAQSRS